MPPTDRIVFRDVVISSKLSSFLKSTSSGIKVAYQNTIGSADLSTWADLFVGGYWVDSNGIENLGSTIQDNFIKITTYNAIK